MSWLLKAMDNRDPAAPPSERAVQEDSRLLIIAGRYVNDLFIYIYIRVRNVDIL